MKNIVINKYHIDLYSLTGYLLIFCTFFIRPFFFAEKGVNAALGSILFLILVVLLLSYSVKLKDKWILNYLFVSSLIFLFVFVQSVVFLSGDLLFSIKNIVTIIPVLLAGGILLSIKKIRKVYFRGLTFLLFISAFSGLITTILILFVGWNKLYIGSIDYSYHVNASLLFPFSFYYGSFNEYSILFLPRLLSFFRESGIAQIMFFWFAIICPLYGVKNYFVRLVLLIGCLLTFSTMGILGFVIGSSYIFLEHKYEFRLSKNVYILFVLGFIMAIIAFYYLPVIGLQDKMTGDLAESFYYRYEAFYNALISLKNNPFGVGLNINPFGSEGDASNLLIASYQIGIHGFLLYFVLITFPFIHLYLKKISRLRIILIAIPIYATILFAQPLHFVPFFYFMLTTLYDVSTKENITVNHNTNIKFRKVS